MKILWVNTGYLHPTTRGGQIRTLETLRQLHRRHEVHYAALDPELHPEGQARAKEYCSYSYPVPHPVPEKRSLAFAGQLAAGLLAPEPVTINRFRSPALRQLVGELEARHRFDVVICDFLASAPNLPDLSRAVLFQHNVEAIIWERHAQNGRTAAHRWYFARQAAKMRRYEAQVCRQSRRVIAVSEVDAETMRRDYGLAAVDTVATGVDVDFFRPPATPSERRAELVFLGSMDWMPNVDGVEWFVRDIFPLIRQRRPDCRLAVVGRRPGASIQGLASPPQLTVTGTVDDVRPWLHGGAALIVPLRVGGGTRLKIYEGMAAGLPVVSTAVGAEGLDCQDGVNVHLADTPADFADRCLRLLDDPAAAARMAAAAARMVADQYSWDAVGRQFEALLEASRQLAKPNSLY